MEKLTDVREAWVFQESKKMENYFYSNWKVGYESVVPSK